jgi:hypothetical protein
MESVDLKTNRGTAVILETFGPNALDSEVNTKMRPEKCLQAQLLSEMMAIDKPRAITSMRAWATFVQLASQTRSLPFETLEQYMPSRAIDAGEL